MYRSGHNIVFTYEFHFNHTFHIVDGDGMGMDNNRNLHISKNNEERCNFKILMYTNEYAI